MSRQPIFQSIVDKAKENCDKRIKMAVNVTLENSERLVFFNILIPFEFQV